MGSGDLPGLQSRRFDPSRVEWWIRLPHASAKPSVYAVLAGETGSNLGIGSNCKPILWDSWASAFRRCRVGAHPELPLLTQSPSFSTNFTDPAELQGRLEPHVG